MHQLGDDIGPYLDGIAYLSTALTFLATKYAQRHPPEPKARG